jgi:predicted component of type VI protein secretion system
MSSSWLFALQVAEAESRYHWPARVCMLTGAAGVEYPTAPRCEVDLTAVQDLALAERGLLVASAHAEQKRVTFVEARSCRLPTGPDRKDARLEVLLCATRFGHTLGIQARDLLARPVAPTEVETFLQRWLDGYVMKDTEKATLMEKARRPLLSAKVKVVLVKDRPWAFELHCELRPHFQIEPVPTEPVRLSVPVWRK